MFDSHFGFYVAGLACETRKQFSELHTYFILRASRELHSTRY